MEKVEKCECGCQERELTMWEKFIKKVKCVYYRLIRYVYRHRDNEKLIKKQACKEFPAPWVATKEWDKEWSNDRRWS